MQIRQISAALGKLPPKQLTLQPGLNIIYTPHESPSAWCQFLQGMFYGLPQPQDGSPLTGTLTLDRQNQSYTLTRSNVPSIESADTFTCLHTDTSAPVAGITAQNCGDLLLGLSHDIFAHTAVIDVPALSAEENFRTLTHTEEDSIVSSLYQAQATYLAAVKEELSQLDQALAQYDALLTQYDAAKTQVRQTTQQTEDLRQALAQYQALDLQEAVRRCRQAKEQATSLYQHFLQLKAQDPHLPTAEELQQLSAMADALEEQLQAADAANADARRHRQEQEAAQDAWCAHRLYPLSEASLTGRQQAAPKSAALSPLSVLLSLLIGTAAGMAVWSFLPQMTIAVGTGGGVSLFLLLIWYCLRRRRRAAKNQQYALHQQEVQTYLELLHRADACAQQAQTSADTAIQLHRRCQESLLLLLSRVQPFHPQAMDLTSSRAALHSAMQARETVENALQSAQDAAAQAQQMEAQLPQGPLPRWDATLPRPVVSRIQVENALTLSLSRQEAAQQREAQLAQQLHALGDRQAVQHRRDTLHTEYLYLQQSQTTPDATAHHLPPVVLVRTAAAFSQLTGQSYTPQQMAQVLPVLLHGPAEVVQQLPVQSVLAPLTLALHLAVCDLLLPQAPTVPLLLNDALTCLDDAHAALALDFLSRLGERRQILLFTQQKRVAEDLAKQRKVTSLSL